MDHNTIETSLQLIRDSIWNADKPQISQLDNADDVFQFLNAHSIAAIPGNLINKISMSVTVKEKWRKYIYQQLYTYKNYVYAQEYILARLRDNKIPVVVLKGTSASRYYPIPEYRAVGDIDLLVKQNDFDRAKNVILQSGYIESNPDEVLDRHISMVKDHIMIELHWRFASENVINNPTVFDDILFADIELDRTILGQATNGLVLLEHIAQHLNGGIGLRQIIDWMLYVNTYLSDKVWITVFHDLAERTGLKELAICVTRMCQLYLGLPTENISWCSGTEEKMCNDLMDYIVNCGNFGHSREIFDSGVITKIPSLSHPILLFRYVQKHGETSWKLAKKHPFIKPFSWIYQSLKYVRMANEANADSEKVKKMYDEAKRRRRMFSKLGINIKQL